MKQISSESRYWTNEERQRFEKALKTLVDLACSFLKFCLPFSIFSLETVDFTQSELMPNICLGLGLTLSQLPSLSEQGAQLKSERMLKNTMQSL